MPLVLAPTIWGDQLELSLVYRNSGMSVESAENLLESILSAICEFAGVPRPRVETPASAKPQLISAK